MRGRRPSSRSRIVPRRRGRPTKQPSRSFATRSRGTRSGNNIKKNRATRPVNVAEARRRAGARTFRGRPVGASPGGPKLAKKKKPISVAELRKKAGARTVRGRPVGASPRRGRPMKDLRPKPGPKAKGPSIPRGRGGPMKSRGPLPKPLTPPQQAARARALRLAMDGIKKNVTAPKSKSKPIPRRRARPVKKPTPRLSRRRARVIPRRRG